MKKIKIEHGFVYIDWDKVKTKEDFKTILRYAVNPSGKCDPDLVDIDKIKHLLIHE